MSSPVFILLSAGKTKIRGCSDAAPMISISSTKLINRQVSTIKKEYPRAKILLVAGYLFDDISLYMKKKHPNVKLIKNLDFKNTSSVHSLSLALEKIENRDLFIIHGDRLFSKSAIKRNSTSYTSYIKIDEKNPNIGISFNSKNELLHISYGLDNVWSEILFLKKEDLPSVKSVLKKAYTIPELINLSNVTMEVTFDRSIKTLKEIL